MKKVIKSIRNKNLLQVLLPLCHLKSPPLTKIKQLSCYHVIGKLIFIGIFSIMCLHGNDICKVYSQRTILSGIVDETTSVDIFMQRQIIESNLFFTAHLSFKLTEFNSSISCLFSIFFNLWHIYRVIFFLFLRLHCTNKQTTVFIMARETNCFLLIFILIYQEGSRLTTNKFLIC